MLRRSLRVPSSRPSQGLAGETSVNAGAGRMMMGYLTRLLAPASQGTTGCCQDCCQKAWSQELWDIDVRTEGSGPLGRRTPILGGLQQVADRATRDAMRASTACALDGVDLDRAGIPNSCACGLESPAARHLTFKCPLRQDNRERRGDTEERP